MQNYSIQVEHDHDGYYHVMVVDMRGDLLYDYITEACGSIAQGRFARILDENKTCGMPGNSGIHWMMIKPEVRQQVMRALYDTVN